MYSCVFFPANNEVELKIIAEFIKLNDSEAKSCCGNNFSGELVPHYDVSHWYNKMALMSSLNANTPGVSLTDGDRYIIIEDTNVIGEIVVV